MYVSGLGTPGWGTVLPTLAASWRKGIVGSATVVATNPANAGEILSKVAEIQRRLGTALPVDYEPRGNERDPRAYQRVAEERRYDCAIVSVPDDLHFEVTRDLIERALHVLVVKPFTPTLDEADALIALQRERNVYGAVEFHKRFDEANLRARRSLREGAIGDLLYALVEFSQRRTIPTEHFAAWASRTNIFQYLGVHYVDMIRFCTGARPLRVLALGQKVALRAAGIDTWDAMQVTVEWAGNAAPFVSTILTNWIDPLGTPAMSGQKIQWIGTRGRIESDQRDRGLSLITDAGTQLINPYFSDILTNADDQLEFRGYGPRSIEQFLVDVQALRGGGIAPADLRGARATFEEARVSTAVVEAASRSLEAGSAWITLDRDTLRCVQ